MFYFNTKYTYKNMKIQLGNWSYKTINYDINTNVLNDYEYISISNENILNRIYEIICDDMQQGENPYVMNLGNGYINNMGFFDYYNNKKSKLSWESFKDFLSLVKYKFEIKDDILVLNPIHYNSYSYSDIKDKIYTII